MAGVPTTDVLVTALIAMAKILVITLIGAICALRPKENVLIPAAALPIMGRLCNLLFLPGMYVIS